MEPLTPLASSSNDTRPPQAITQASISYSQRILRDELQRRQNRNASYSLRALARDLKLPRTTVSDVIQGKRRLSKTSVERLQSRLKLDEHEVERLKKEGQSEWFETKSENDRRILEDEEIELMSNWYYYGILNLARLPGCRADARWIAKRLGIETKVCRQAMDRIVSLNLAEVVEGELKRTAQPLQTRRDVPSRLSRDLHRQFLNLAESKLETVDIAARDFSTVTIPVSKMRLPKAKDMIHSFRRKLADFLSEAPEDGVLDSVYSLSIQLFPTVEMPVAKTRKENA